MKQTTKNPPTSTDHALPTRGELVTAITAALVLKNTGEFKHTEEAIATMAYRQADAVLAVGKKLKDEWLANLQNEQAKEDLDEAHARMAEEEEVGEGF